MLSRRLFLLTASMFAASPALAALPYWSIQETGFAADGADVVVYFELQASKKRRSDAVVGNDKFQTNWNGAKWRFSSKDNLRTFVANPEKFAPQYGGYCSLSLAFGKLSIGDPDAWYILRGKLYLNGSKRSRSKWRKKLVEYVNKANRNWPAVLDA